MQIEVPAGVPHQSLCLARQNGVAGQAENEIGIAIVNDQLHQLRVGKVAVTAHIYKRSVLKFACRDACSRVCCASFDAASSRPAQPGFVVLRTPPAAICTVFAGDDRPHVRSHFCVSVFVRAYMDPTTRVFLAPAEKSGKNRGQTTISNALTRILRPPSPSWRSPAIQHRFDV